MKLSIIIVNYHTDRLLQRCIESIKKQDVNFDYEIIVEDNSHRNIGFGAANNLGARKSKGEYLFLLNPDTLLEEVDTLRRLVNYLDDHPGVGIVAPRLVDKEGRYQWSANYEVSLWQMLLDKPLAVLYRYLGQIKPIAELLSLLSLRYEFNKVLTGVDRVSGAALMIRRQVFNQVEGFDEDFFMYFEDDDLCQRVRKLGYGICYYPLVTIRHMVGPTLSGKIDTKEKYYYNNQDRYFQKHRPRWEQYLTKILRFPYRVLRLRRLLNRYF